MERGPVMRFRRNFRVKVELVDAGRMAVLLLDVLSGLTGEKERGFPMKGNIS
jgi:hypothetical protein